MIVAQKKRKENIAEYILYMWQVEDLIRAARFDTGRIREMIVARYDCQDAEREEIAQWYENLAERMIAEGIAEKGHLLSNTAILNRLSDLHQSILKSCVEPVYQSNYYKVLPHIVALRAKAGSEQTTEIETCFTALYGYLNLKLQRRDVSDLTEEAMRQISAFIAMLAAKYRDSEDLSSN
jgi:hypothetical protein